MENKELYIRKFIQLGMTETEASELLDGICQSLRKGSCKELFIEKVTKVCLDAVDAEILYNAISSDYYSQGTPGYCIKVEYQTGDSYHSYNTSDTINLPWHNLAIAQENVRRLREHVKYYNMLNGWMCDKPADKIKEEWLSKEWSVIDTYSHAKPDKVEPCEFSVTLLNDRGEPFQYSTSWVGYFEGNQKFSIIMAPLVDEDDDIY